jgi:hypothetical protein
MTLLAHRVTGCKVLIIYGILGCILYVKLVLVHFLKDRVLKLTLFRQHDVVAPKKEMALILKALLPFPARF